MFEVKAAFIQIYFLIGAESYYLTSEFTEKTASAEVFEKFESVCSSFPKEKNDSSVFGGTKCKFKFFEVLDERKNDSNLNQLISIEACGLHALNGAIQNGENTTR